MAFLLYDSEVSSIKALDCCCIPDILIKPSHDKGGQLILLNVWKDHPNISEVSSSVNTSSGVVGNNSGQNSSNSLSGGSASTQQSGANNSAPIPLLLSSQALGEQFISGANSAIGLINQNRHAQNTLNYKIETMRYSMSNFLLSTFLTLIKAQNLTSNLPSTSVPPGALNELSTVIPNGATTIMSIASSIATLISSTSSFPSNSFSKINLTPSANTSTPVTNVNFTALPSEIFPAAELVYKTHFAHETVKYAHTRAIHHGAKMIVCGVGNHVNERKRITLGSVCLSLLDKYVGLRMSSLVEIFGTNVTGKHEENINNFSTTHSLSTNSGSLVASAQLSPQHVQTPTDPNEALIISPQQHLRQILLQSHTNAALNSSPTASMIKEALIEHYNTAISKEDKDLYHTPLSVLFIKNRGQTFRLNRGLRYLVLVFPEELDEKEEIDLIEDIKDQNATADVIADSLKELNNPGEPISTNLEKRGRFKLSKESLKALELASRMIRKGLDMIGVAILLQAPKRKKDINEVQGSPALDGDGEGLTDSFPEAKDNVGGKSIPSTKPNKRGPFVPVPNPEINSLTEEDVQPVADQFIQFAVKEKLIEPDEDEDEDETRDVKSPVSNSSAGEGDINKKLEDNSSYSAPESSSGSDGEERSAAMRKSKAVEGTIKPASNAQYEISGGPASINGSSGVASATMSSFYIGNFPQISYIKLEPTREAPFIPPPIDKVPLQVTKLIGAIKSDILIYPTSSIVSSQSLLPLHKRKEIAECNAKKRVVIEALLELPNPHVLLSN